MRILVVDDEPALRSSLERALGLDRHEVELAEDGMEALDRLALAPVDAVVLDVSMPGIDGLEVCRRLRAAGDRTPVLMLTARDAIDDRVEGLDAGADDYLVKPFALRELQARLRALLRRSEEPAARRSSTATSCSTRMRARCGAAGGRSSSRAPSSRCCSCSSHTRARCSRARSCSSAYGATTSVPARTCSASTSAIGGARRKAGGEPRLLQTVRGIGYVLRDG
jgi:two-component system, OmpR family, response regulator MprA